MRLHPSLLPGTAEHVQRCGADVAAGDAAGGVGLEHREQRRAAAAANLGNVLRRVGHRQGRELQHQVPLLLEEARLAVLRMKPLPAVVRLVATAAAAAAARPAALLANAAPRRLCQPSRHDCGLLPAVPAHSLLLPLLLQQMLAQLAALPLHRGHP